MARLRMRKRIGRRLHLPSGERRLRRCVSQGRGDDAGYKTRDADASCSHPKVVCLPPLTVTRSLLITGWDNRQQAPETALVGHLRPDACTRTDLVSVVAVPLSNLAMVRKQKRVEPALSQCHPQSWILSRIGANRLPDLVDPE